MCECVCFSLRIKTARQAELKTGCCRCWNDFVSFFFFFLLSHKLDFLLGLELFFLKTVDNTACLQQFGFSFLFLCVCTLISICFKSVVYIFCLFKYITFLCAVQIILQRIFHSLFLISFFFWFVTRSVGHLSVIVIQLTVDFVFFPFFIYTIL